MNNGKWNERDTFSYKIGSIFSFPATNFRADDGNTKVEKTWTVEDVKKRNCGLDVKVKLEPIQQRQQVLIGGK